MILYPPLLITQPDHAALAATIMRGWESGGLPESPRHVAIMLAIQAHDNGWQEADAEPCLDPATGRVLDFVHVPEDVRHAVWKRGVGRLTGEPYAAALVAQHAVHIYRRMRQQPGWRQFFVDMTAARDEHLTASHETVETLQREYAFLRLADLASLTFCGVDTGGQAHEMGYDITLEGTRLLVSPDPFKGATFDISIEGRELASAFASVADARAAWQAAPRRRLSGVVTGGSSRL
ncbi:MAG TPA: DUF3891 family protein [Vicinamibacterales bacterium]|nr:DUF3891 family protein [Vicinamibacterales bacterium]